MKFRNETPAEQFYMSICPHCYMNCKNCLAVSPLMSERYCSIDQFNNSLEFINRYNRSIAPKILYIGGGDCFLHKDLNTFIVIAHQKFPDTRIRICSNGLHLNEISDSDWLLWKENNASVKVRSYSLKRYMEWKKKGLSMGVMTGNFSHHLENPVIFAEMKFLKYPHYNSEMVFNKCCTWDFCKVITCYDERFMKCDRIVGWDVLFPGRLQEGYDYFCFHDIDSIDFDKMKQVFIPPSCNYCKGQYKNTFVWTNKGTRTASEWIDTYKSDVEKQELLYEESGKDYE